MAKRKSAPMPKTSTVAKRARQDLQFTNIKSIRQQAEPYRLATARFPIDALTSTWRIGSNRPIDTKHVQDLCRMFEEQGLQRELSENHLLVACSRDEFDRMIDHLRKVEKGLANSEDDPSSWHAFHDWTAVNKCQAEIMGGQHRVEALRVFLARISKRSGESAVATEQAWWVCEIYDQGKV
jgi:hypothetical protein